MSMLQPRLTPLLVALLLPALAIAQDSERDKAAIAYEECASRVFVYSDKLSDVFEECEAEMDAFTMLLEEEVRDTVKQQVMANTQREQRARIKERKEKEKETRRDGEQ